MQQGKQQEQDARDEDRAAGQENTDEGEHCASKQEDGPPAGLHGAHGPNRLPARADAFGPASAGVSRSISAPSFVPGSHQTLPGNVLVPCLQDNCLTAIGLEQMSPVLGCRTAWVRDWPRHSRTVSGP